jgi:hypothetical protein
MDRGYAFLPSGLSAIGSSGHRWSRAASC